MKLPLWMCFLQHAHLLLLFTTCIQAADVADDTRSRSLGPLPDVSHNLPSPVLVSKYLNGNVESSVDEELKDFSVEPGVKENDVRIIASQSDSSTGGRVAHPVKPTVVSNALFNHSYSGMVNDQQQYMFVYNYTEGIKISATRISLSSSAADEVYPVTCVMRQQEGILSFQLPLQIGNSFSYWSASRTLCPLDKKHKKHIEKEQLIYVTVSSMSKENKDFRLTANKVDDFEVGHDVPKQTKVATARPQYFMYQFPEGVNKVMLRVTSASKTCMTVSVQKIKCPVFDLDTNVLYDGKHQTMSTQASMLLMKEDYAEGNGFYLVFITQPSDEACEGKLRPFAIKPSNRTQERAKVIDLIVTDTITDVDYIKATFAAFGFFFAFYILAFIIFCVCHGWGLPKAMNEMDPDDLDRESDYLNRTDSPHHDIRSGSYGAISCSEDELMPRRGLRRELSAVSTASSHLDESGIDFLPDVELEKDVFRTKTALFVSDLARKKPSKLAKIYKLFYWNLLTIAIFYGLPVVQLVITYQKVLNDSGNEDLCYYNFDCAHPWKDYLNSFNNVYSNIGYVMLGLLFIILVRMRDVQNKRLVAEYGDLAGQFGIPQHFGLFYSMGLALCMEGFMSACYHVCPSYTNFQFDTSFMYIIACLIMLKIYQCRHPDINAKAHVAFFSMALIIFIAVIGVVYGSNIFWIFYALIHMLVTLVLSAQIYYMGRWSIDRYIFKRMFLIIVSDFRRCNRPVYPNRFCLLLVGNIVNWAFALYGALYKPANFASFFLAIFIGNLLLYTVFYLLMKLLSQERLSWLIVVVILVSSVTWAFSLFFFMQNLTSWQETPAGSRAGNKMCILLKFYDAHDIWHFLSALSMFFSFLIILLLDDDLAQTRRDTIPVF